MILHCWNSRHSIKVKKYMVVSACMGPTIIPPPGIIQVYWNNTNMQKHSWDLSRFATTTYSLPSFVFTVGAGHFTELLSLLELPQCLHRFGVFLAEYVSHFYSRASSRLLSLASSTTARIWTFCTFSCKIYNFNISFVTMQALFSALS